MKKIVLFIFLSFTLFANTTTQNTTTDNVVKVQEKLPFIALSDVPQNAAKLTTELKKLQEIVTPSKKIVELQSSVKPYADSLDDFLKAPNYQDFSTQNTRDLQKMQSEIAIYIKQLKQWEIILKDRITLYDENRKILSQHSALWSQTHINAINQDTPEVILQHITSVIVSIEELSNNLKIKYDTTLINSQILTTYMLKLQDINTALAKEEELIRNRIFFQNEPTLFTMFSIYDISLWEFIHNIDKVIIEKYNESYTYVQTNPELTIKFILSLFASILFIGYFNFLYRKNRLFVLAESSGKKAFYFLKKPFSTLIIFAVLGATAIFTNQPKSFVEIELLLLIIPVISIFSTVINKELHRYIYTFFMLYILYIIDKNSIDYELESRILMLLITVSLLVYNILLLKNKVLCFIKYQSIIKLGNFILMIFILLLLVAIGSNLYGSVMLCNRILHGILTIFYASMIFYTIYLVLTGYVVIIFRRRISSASSTIDLYSQKIEKTIKILIQIWMFSWWLLVVSKITGAYPFIINFRGDFLALSWQVSNITISVQSIFDFLIIVVATWVIARFTKTILEIEVFARFNFPRGVPTAVLTTINYLIVISGAVIAFSSLGISSQQFALIFGALGVGIGFGLRNIIANFVSGIIMVFERPVQIGDTIEVDGTMGSVQSIGARSSVIKTFDGSEVIIPNADFIAKEIINWTLSNEHRRKTVEFKVALGNDIEKILEIIKDVAISHPDVLKDPAPLATFKGFGEYHLSFKLYFWLSDNLIVAHSEISIEIYRKLQEAEIEMPVPITNVKQASS
ncbi:MAG: mechanosensitive ion channel [Campylobacterota bacterium]|nr:mechanosensitive ion channel [Campylobacterota bacterium]